MATNRGERWQRFKERSKNAGKEATKGAIKEGAKGAVKGGVKGGVKGAKRGAQIGGAAGKAAGAGAGAAIGSVVPGVGTAVGARVGSMIGGGVGKGVGAAAGAGAGAGIGAAKGGAKGAAKGARQGAAKGWMKGGKIPTQDMRGTQENQASADPASMGFTQGAKGMRQAINALNKARKMTPKQDLRQAAMNPRNLAKAGIRALPVVGTAYMIFENRKLILYIAIAIILLLFFLLALFMENTSSGEQEQADQQNQLQVTKEGPTTAKKGDKLNYTITVSYPGSATGLTITDPLPDGTSYDSSSPSGQFKPPQQSAGKGSSVPLDNGSVTWDSTKNKMNLSNPINVTVHLTLKATKDNNNVGNIASATLTGASSTGGGGSIGGNAAANHNTCGGKYKFTSPLGNFGDPQCNFTHQALGTELTQLDAAHKYTWDCIATYESTGGSGYNPNAYNGGSASGKGAYGLFQMNPSGKGNGQYDSGDVNWPVQTSNAINYNKKMIGGNFSYWGTYQSHGGPCH